MEETVKETIRAALDVLLDIRKTECESNPDFAHQSDINRCCCYLHDILIFGDRDSKKIEDLNKQLEVANGEIDRFQAFIEKQESIAEQDYDPDSVIGCLFAKGLLIKYINEKKQEKG